MAQAARAPSSVAWRIRLSAVRVDCGVGAQMQATGFCWVLVVNSVGAQRDQTYTALSASSRSRWLNVFGYRSASV